MNERFFKLLVVCGLLCFLSASRASAQTNTGRPLSENRWLPVVDTSHAMQRRADGLRRVANALVLSGMNGQMRRGDTLGLWTYNEGLSAGQFRLQNWTPESREVIARRVVAFLKDQKFEKDGRI